MCDDSSITDTVKGWALFFLSNMCMYTHTHTHTKCDEESESESEVHTWLPFKWTKCDPVHTWLPFQWRKPNTVQYTAPHTAAAFFIFLTLENFLIPPLCVCVCVCETETESLDVIRCESVR